MARCVHLRPNDPIRFTRSNMAHKQSHSGNKSKARAGTGKVGSDTAAAKAVGGKNDFGAAESNTIERNYTSANTKASDRGGAQPHSGENEDRTTGVGGQASGVGSSSGGDIDTDIVGVGTGGSGIAQGPAGAPPAADDTEGTSKEFASGKPATGRTGTKAGAIQGDTVDHSGGG